WRIKTHLHRGANWYMTKMGPRYKSVPFLKPQHHVIDATNARRAFNNSIEYRLHIRRRTTDDTEYLRCRRLMLQRLAQFCVAFLYLFEQAHVLDRNDGLVGKGLKKFDLTISERADLHSTNRNRADRDAFAEQRRGQHSPKTELIHGDLALWELVIGLSR